MNQNLENKDAVPLSQEGQPTKIIEEKEQRPASLDDMLTEMQTETKALSDVEMVQEKVNKEQEKETEHRWQEARKPTEEAIEEIKRNEEVYDGELYYGTLKDKGDAYLHREEQKADLDIAEGEQEIQLAKIYHEVTGKSFDRDSTPEESIASREKGVAEAKQKKETGFTDEEKTNFRNYQWGVKSSLQGGAGNSIPVIHEWSLNNGGKEYITSPLQLIDQMAKVREYRRSDKYMRAPRSEEIRNREHEIHDDVYGYNSVAQGVVFVALEDGDIQTAVKALVFSEKIKPMGSDKMERVKSLLAKLDVGKRKSFIEAYQAEKGA